MCCNQIVYSCGLDKGDFCSASCQSSYVGNLPHVNVSKKKRGKESGFGSESFTKALEEKYGEGVKNASHIPEVRAAKSAHFSQLHADGVYRRALQANYGEGIVNPSQIPELKERNRATQRLAQSRPETLVRQLEAKEPTLLNKEEYVTLDHAEWAINFQLENGYAPSPTDLQRYFNKRTAIRIPYEAKQYYDLKDSQLELRFQWALESCGYKINKDFYRRKRFLAGEGIKRALELDFFFPREMVAFEIQDFATHSRDSDSELGFFGKTKAGPAYHSRKQDAAAHYRIRLFEFWEDEFTDDLETEIQLCLLAEAIDPLAFDSSLPYYDDVVEYFSKATARGEYGSIPKSLIPKEVT